MNLAVTVGEYVINLDISVTAGICLQYDVVGIGHKVVRIRTEESCKVCKLKHC
jgi:hypothetical protein